MAIDSSIYNSLANVKPIDIAGNFDQGLQMSQLLQQRNDENAKRQAFKDAIVTDANGNKTVDFDKASNNLMSHGLGDEAVKIQQLKAQQAAMRMQQQEAAQKNQINEARYTIQTADPKKVYDQPTYDQLLQQGIKDGHGDAVAKMPKEFNPDLIKQMYDHAKDIIPKDELLKQQLTESEIAKNKSTVNKNNYDINVGKVDKEIAKLNQDLTKGWTARSGQAGKVQEKINNADAVLQLLQQGKTQDGGLDSRQMEEAALAAGRLLGATAMGQVQALLPKTLLGKTMTVAEFIDNNPHGAQQQAFANRLEETINREKNLALDQKREYQIGMLGAHQGLAKRNPEAYNAELIRQGIDPSMIDEKGRYKKPQQNVHPVDQMSDEEVKAAYEAKFGKSK